jgi:alpha-D-ribose 1-methylphosphonate 5-triphosphate synthase subunit PhnH
MMSGHETPQHNDLVAGFSDPVHESQNAFRCALDALARPGRPVTLGKPVKGLSLGPAMAHLLLALTDDDSAVWWQENRHAAVAWLRFHTSAGLSNQPSNADFAVVTEPANLPDLDVFAAGSNESPESSTTVFVEVASLKSGRATQWQGPGIRTTQRVQISGLPDRFWAQWQSNHASFPQGIDIIFTCADQAIGLPRSTQVQLLPEAGEA